MKSRYSTICALIYAIPFLSITSAGLASDLANANNAFAIDLYKNLAKEPGNLVVSPFSINTALTMAYAGAREQTASQMAKVLHIPSGNTNIHSGFAALLKALNGTNVVGCQFEIANSLWAQKGFTFLKPYQELLRDDYSASLNEINLTGWPKEFDPAIAAAARKQINDWIAERTRNKITEMVPPRLPDPETLLILVNGISFKGTWVTQFDKAKTTDSPFHPTPGETISVPIMHTSGLFRVGGTETLQVLELPYVSNRFSMIILLPYEYLKLKLEDVEKTLTPALIEQLGQKCENQEVAVSLPRFKLGSEFDLKKPLKVIGMEFAFDERADFSGITQERPFFIENVLHKACVDVDEAGTEAAAATVVSFTKGGSAPFSADHPFLFLIRDNKTGIIIFLGRVVDPSKQ
ncbi:MAG: serpin family protein [Verrucomicrobiia bacterium]